VLNQDGGEVLNVEVADKIGLILDINPDKLLLGMFRSQCLEARPVLFADIAPCGAQAGYYPPALVQGTSQLGEMVWYQK
jgi:hypothetical protein